MSRRALVVGGTGPTGPHVVNGLRKRGFEVTILHRGTHEIAEQDDLEHIHVDPHFLENLQAGVAGRSFDVVVAMYGRLRHVASALAGQCGQFLAVSGAPAYPGYHHPQSLWPQGMPVPATERDADMAEPVESTSPGARFATGIRAAEKHVLDLHRSGAFSAGLFRYPSIYGPRQVYPREWSIIRRVRDGRDFMILPDSGLTINMRCSAHNAAHFVLTAVDNPVASAGEIFNVGDLEQFTLRQWAQLVSRFAGRELDLVSLPFELAGPARGLFPMGHTDHMILSLAKAPALLDYREAIPAERALKETVRWYLAHPPEARVEAGLADAFDYDAEDRSVDAYRRVVTPLLAEQVPLAGTTHPYAHPAIPGQVDHLGR